MRTLPLDLGTHSVDIHVLESPADVPANYRRDPDMGGGALLDVGGYAVHTWVSLMSSAAPFAALDVERAVAGSGIDLTTRVVGRVGRSTRVQALCSFEQPESQSLHVGGSAADVRALGPSAFTSWREPSSLLVGGHEEVFPAVDAYQVMVEEVSATVRGGEGWVVPISDSVRVAEILDAIAAADAAHQE